MTFFLQANRLKKTLPRRGGLRTCSLGNLGSQSTGRQGRKDRRNRSYRPGNARI